MTVRYKLTFRLLVVALFCLYGFSPLTAQQVKSRKDSTQKVEIDTLKAGQSKSDYNQLRKGGGSQSVGADLANDDVKKNAWLGNIKVLNFSGYYDFKRKLNKKYGLAIGADFMFLNQYSSFSFTDDDATSSIFRFFGTWQTGRKNRKNNGSLTYKIENRTGWGDGVTPRNLAYEAGAALSTASFKDFGWGLTNFYWKQIYNDKFAVVLGVIDPGDWLDLYPQLNPYKFFLNEAFFNSPAMGLPNQGLGFAVHWQDIIGDLYFSGGMNDANGEPFMWIVDNVKSFFNTKEYLYWAELGWDFADNVLSGESVHVMYWQQDARVETGVPSSWGIDFSFAKNLYGGRYTAFVRGGFAKGAAPIMENIIMAGATMKVVKFDVLGIGFNYGTPFNANNKRQLGTELFYSIQLTEHMNITPDVQLTFNPSFNDQKDVIGIYSVVRMRYAL